MNIRHRLNEKRWTPEGKRKMNRRRIELTQRRVRTDTDHIYIEKNPERRQKGIIQRMRQRYNPR